MKRIVVLGSTGSIGAQTLDIVRQYPAEFQVLGLSAHENSELFEKQVREFHPKYTVQTAVSENPVQALSVLASAPDADLVVNAVAGTAGLMPAYAACKAGKRMALANKECMVMAGELIMKTAQENGAQILPVDSEPSAIWQVIGMGQAAWDRQQRAGGRMQEIEKVILTASGGPFWKWKREELEHVTAEQALKHPTWKMGEKVSIDSATLMNKAFEIIETRWLFGIPQEKIDVTIHRQSFVHAFVQFIDGNVSAALSVQDMRIPISYALFYPERRENSLPRIDFSKLDLTFEKPDYSVFEGPKLAYEMLESGGIMPAAFCISDEIAVSKFLSSEISFLGIYDFIKRALSNVKNMPLSMEALTLLNSLMRVP